MPPSRNWATVPARCLISSDRFGRNFPLGIDRYVGKGAVGHGNPNAATPDNVRKLWKNFGEGFCRAGGRGHNGLARSARPAQVAVRLVVQALVGGVGMYCGDVCLFNAAKVQDYFEHRGGIIGGAGRIGNDGVLLCQNGIVYAKNHRFNVIVYWGNGKDNLSRAVG